MIQIKNKVDCCGCNACGDVCAHQAITFKTDIEGFWYPVVNKDKCTDCHLCEKVCPILNVKELHNDFETPLCYAAMHKNYEVRFDSTSGGLFSAFAEKVYRDGGYVGGAVFNEDWSIRHFISNNKADLQQLRSSKYAQSDASGIYIQIRDLLRNGEKVLICSAPCQIAALKSFLHKDFDNLYTLDFICRGVNSPKIDKKGDADDEKESGAKIVYKKAKNKELGWKNLTYKVIFANGKVKYQTRDTSPSTRGYLKMNVFSRPSCYDCKFKGKQRYSDITLADFWGIENVDKSMDDNLGTSLVMIHSHKGKDLYDSILQKLKTIEVPFDSVVVKNPMLLKSQPSPLVDRDAFYADLDKFTYKEVAEKYFPYEEKFKQKVKRALQIVRSLYITYHYNIFQLPRFIYYNFIKRNVSIRFLHNGLLYFSNRTVVDIHHTAKINLEAPFYIGLKKVRKSKLESRFIMERDSSLEVKSSFACMYGADIEIFRGASLVIRGDLYNQRGGGPNIGFTLICGNHIEIGEECRIGRNVTIRDNNGGHYMSIQGYKTSKPVIIGKHVWICEGATIMQGVKIGDGAIIGSHSVVYSNVPAFSLVSGNPARVVQTNIFWKY
jgi:acetyltransferase-like isoleucine patch superfamily enzyme/coenzyme F420-reducing hydrogenase beta subunit